MAFPLGTTPTFKLTFKRIDMTRYKNHYVTLEGEGAKLTKTGDSLQVEPHKITVALTQEESLSLGEGKLEVQVNAVDENGKRAASNIAACMINRQLLQEVIE